MKNTCKSLVALALMAGICAAHAARPIVVNVASVELDAYTMQHLESSPIVVEQWDSTLAARRRLVVASAPLVREWDVAVAVPAMFDGCSISASNVVARFGLLSAVPGTVSAQILGSDGEWRNTAADTNGALAVASPRPPPRGTSLKIGSVDYDSGELLIDIPRWGRYLSATNVLAAATSLVARVRVAWTPRGYSGGRAYAPTLSPRRSGTNSTCAVYADIDGSGSWTPGEPYGVAIDADRLWGAPEFQIGLADADASTMRIDLKSALGVTSFEEQHALTDRGVNGYANCTNMPVVMKTDYSTDYAVTRMRIYRLKVNGIGTYRAPGTSTVNLAYECVADITKNLNVSRDFTEADLIREGKNDLDWGNLARISSGLNISYNLVNNAQYVMLIGNGAFLSGEIYANTEIEEVITNVTGLAVSFANGFETGAAQTLAVPLSPSGSLGVSRPTFKWTHENSIGKAYPAFELRVWKGDSLIYDSGIRRAPPRDVNGVYAWTPPDLVVADTETPGHVLQGGTNYTWSVSMLDAKFSTPNASETSLPFSTLPTN